MGGDVPYSSATILLFFLLQLAVLVVFGLSVDPTSKTALIIMMMAILLSIVLFKFH
jgi:hypothetical protein